MRKGLYQLFAFVTLICISAVSYAIPFDVKPKSFLPTTIVQGQTLTAFYTVTNKSLRVLTDNFLLYLPQNVTQDFTDNTIPNLCGFGHPNGRFSVQPSGKPGDSCTLKLVISGAVAEQKFSVCAGPYPNSRTCTNTNSPQISVIACPMPAKTLVAVGLYRDFSTFPAEASGGVATSTDQGLNWISKNLIPIDPKFTNETLSSVNCSCNHCVAVGTGQADFGIVELPIAAISSNAAATWSKKTITNLPGDFTDGSWRDINCNGKHCVAVGQYGKFGVRQLGSATSEDGGNTWLPQALPIPNTPSGLQFGDLTSVSCVGNHCVAVGEYQATEGRNFPAVILSEDGGKTWAKQQLVLTPPSPNTIGLFNSVSCTSFNCVAVGAYGNSMGVAVSNDGGASWQQSVLPTSFPQFSPVSLTSVSCQNSFCVAVGFYENGPGDVFAGTRVVSYNGGASWSADQLFGAGAFQSNAVYCTTALCTAVGFNNNVENAGSARSIDLGQTWALITAFNVPNIASLSLRGVSGTAGV